MVILKKCSEALFKAQQAQFSLQQYEHDREMKIPQLAHAREMEKILKKQVEDARQDYADARQKCVLEEENIENLENEVETLRIENKAAFHETNPMFTAAHTAAEALTDKCLDELRRYAHPPKSAVTVLTCLCHMFQISPANWENGRALISKENFFMELEFFDKINMPENVFQTLESYALSPDFQIEKVEKSSFAVAKLCIWIHAIYNYGKEHRILQPKLDAQKEAERKLYEAEATLGLKRVKCNQIKDNLDSKIKEHKLATLKIKQMEKELKFLESKIGRAQNLTENLKEYVGSWSDKRELVKMRLSAAIGDGVLTAACVAYYGSFVFEQREQALRQWKKAAEQGYIDNKSGVFKVDNDYYTMAISRRRIVESSSSTKIKVDSEMSWHEGEAEEASARSSFSQHNKVNAFVKTRENFHLNDILTDASEVREWHRFALPRDDHARFDALRLHSLNLHQDLSWSFIFDPDDQAKKWLDVIVPKLLKDFQNPNLSQDTISNPPRQMSASTNQESFAIYDEEDGRKSSPLTSQSEHTRTGSGMSTEITISVSATTTVVTEKVISSHSTQDEDKHGGDEERCDETNHDTEENKKSSISVKEDTDATTTETEEDGKDGGRKDADVDKETQNFVSPDHKGKVDTTKTPSFPYPLTQLWVCTAVDSRMPSLLHSAISYGALLLVTNIEQASKTNSDILLKISFLSLKNSWRIFHRNFRLFLTTSVSIRTVFHNEKTRLFLPMHRFSIIDMSLNKNVLEEQLESIVLGQERPEFEAQRRLMEADVFHLEERLEILRDDLIQKITSISESLLVNPYIMADIHATRQEMEVVSNSLKESRMMEHNHVQKKADLSKVAGHGRMLFKCVEWTSSLNISLYHLSASKFIKIFQGCLLNHKRGRGSVSMGAMGIGSKGLMKSRVVELKQSLTDVMLRYVRRRFFQSDVVVFTTFVSLNQLVENEKMTKEEMEEFLEVSDRSETNRDKSPRTRIFMSDMLAIERPDWMSVAQWDDVTSLEQRYPDTYATVAYSIASKPKRWIEFLNASPILLAEFPCMKLRKLQLGQKALLWKTLRPDKFNEIASDLNACVIGGSVTTSYTFDLEIVVPDLSFQTPCVFVLPSQYNESCFIPSHHVNSVAKTVGATVMERSALFEGDISDALEQCMINGRWFVLNDCHLVHHWPKKFLQLLTNLQSIDPNSDHLYNLEQERREFQQLSKNSSKYSTYSFLGSHLKSDRDLIDVLLANLQITPSSPNMCHPDFRLFMVTKENKVSNLPGAVTQHAEFLVIETSSSYKDLVQKAYRTLMRAAKQVIKPASHVSATSGPSFMNRIAVPYNVQASNQEVIRLSREQQEMILQLSLLHATLLERITFKEIAFATTCLWTDGELLDALNALLLTQNPSIASTLCSNIILRHVTESMDKEIVREIIEKCFAPVANVGDNSNMFANLVLLLRSGETIQHIFNKLLQKPDLKKLGLQPTSGNENIRIHGTTLSDALRKTCSFNVIQWGKNPLLDNSLIMSAREISLRRSLESMFFELMEIPKAKLNKQITSSVMKDFYAAEVKRLNTVIDVTRHDIGLSLGAVKSNNELTVDLLCILERIAVNKLPMQWLTYHQELFRFHSFQSLSDFIQHLGRRVKLITSYMSAAAEEPQISTEDKDGTPPDMPNSSQSFKSVLNINLRSNLLRDVFAYNLAAFTRPDMFLQSVLFAVARSRHHDAHKYSFTTEIVADIGSYKPLPNNSSFDSIYLDGLRLHKAMYDPKGQVLLEAFSSEPCPMPMLRLTAVKSTARSNESFVARNNVYDCPVWINEQESPSMCLDSNVVIKVPLATNKPKERWFTRGVTITAFLGKD